MCIIGSVPSAVHHTSQPDDPTRNTMHCLKDVLRQSAMPRFCNASCCGMLDVLCRLSEVHCQWDSVVAPVGTQPGFGDE